MWQQGKSLADAKVVTSNFLPVFSPVRPHLRLPRPFCLLSSSYPCIASLRAEAKTDTGSSGCSYQGTKYNHGDQVRTPEQPCLSCTCKRGVLLCFLKVCPTLLHQTGGHNCQTIREPGQCCPVVKCESQPAVTSDDWGSVVTTPITTSASVFQEKQTVGLHVNDRLNQQSNHSESVIKAHSSSSVRLSSEGLVHATTPLFSSYPTPGKQTADGAADSLLSHPLPDSFFILISCSS